MNVREQFSDAVSKNKKTIYYEVPKSGLLKKNSKIKFVIRTLQPEDIMTDDVKKEVMKEVSIGQTMEEASRVIAEKYKRDLLGGGNDDIAKLIISKSVIFPKIVNGKENLKDDELPYSLLEHYWNIKLFLIQEIAKISPMFQGIK